VRSRPVRDLPVLLLLLVPLWLAGARGVALAPWAAVATAAVAVLLATAAVQGGARLHRFLPWLAALVGWAALDAALRPVPAAQAAWLLATGVTAVLLAGICSTPSGAIWARRAVAALGIATAVWLVVERLVASGRPVGPFGETNLAATVALLALAILPAVRLKSAARLSAAVVLLGGVGASGSRAGLLAVLALALLWLVRGRSAAMRRAAVLGAALAVAAMAARVTLDRDPLRFERVRIWGAAARAILAELPLGAGPAGYRDAALPHNFPRDGEFARYHRIPSLAESDPLQLAATLGLPGVVLAAVLLVLVVRQATASAAALGVVVVVAVTSAFHTQLVVPVVACTAAMAVSASLPRPRGPRLTLRPALAASLGLLVAAPAAAALRWPSAGLFPDARVLTAEARRVLVDRGADDRHLAGAEAIAWRACRLRPRDPATWQCLADLRLRRAELRGDAGLAREAVAAYQVARRVDPLDVWAALGGGRAFALLGDTERARSWLRSAVTLEPNCVEGWLELARLRLEAGEVAAARTALRRAEAALRLAARTVFVSGYERALAAADAVTLASLRAALVGPT
jgi:tetratricopeptide (TPR) repeat protein